MIRDVHLAQLAWRAIAAAALAVFAGVTGAPANAQVQAQAPAQAPTPSQPQALATPQDDWQGCTALADGPARLTCFDRWARQQQRNRQQPSMPQPAGGAAEQGNASAAQTGVLATAPAVPALINNTDDGCRDNRYSRLSRFWELERATDCGTFELRGYRPIALSIVAADTVNELPSSPAAGRTAVTSEDYRTTETRIQLSARIKVAKDLLTGADRERSDALWIGFSQQSYWQVFTGRLSRPFRTTDYEPELMYNYPADIALPGGWRLRYAGAALSHQSNGRQLPQSRSWNRGLLMAGAELGDRFSLEARVWRRMLESGTDDNPDISDFMGRGELTGTWNLNQVDTFSTTLRHSLRSHGRGSVRLEYFRALGKGMRIGYLNDLRLHAQFFSGYGDSMLDYNRKRNVLSLGLALVDW